VVVYKNIRMDIKGGRTEKWLQVFLNQSFLKSKQMKVTKVCTPYALIRNQVLDQSMLIPGGSLLYNLQDDVFKLHDENLDFDER